PGVRCVVLNACFTEAEADAIAEHVDYVVGTRAALPDPAAIAFSKGFYRTIGAGESLKKAFLVGVAEAQAGPELFVDKARPGVDPDRIVLARRPRWPWAVRAGALTAVAAAAVVL